MSGASAVSATDFIRWRATAAYQFPPFSSAVDVQVWLRPPGQERLGSGILTISSRIITFAACFGGQGIGWCGFSWASPARHGPKVVSHGIAWEAGSCGGHPRQPDHEGADGVVGVGQLVGCAARMERTRRCDKQAGRRGQEAACREHRSCKTAMFAGTRSTKR